MACVLLVVPHLIVVGSSFDPSRSGVFPPRGVSLRWYASAFERPAFREALGVSVVVASIAGVVAVTIAIMAALLLVRHRFAGRGLVSVLLQSPMMIPEVVLGLGLLIFFSRSRMYLSVVNLVLAHIVITLPYAIRVISANLHSMGASVEEAAYVLGAGPVRTLFQITLPAIKQGVLAAVIFAFVVSFDNFTISMFLVSWRGTLPVEIYSYIRTGGDPTIAAVSAMLIVISVVLVFTVERVVGLEGLAQMRDRRAG
jgi:putative spermidine/putrescine transport system permease protein